MTESNFIFEVTAENFGTIVLEGSRTVPVLVDFWAPWCGPCKTLTPILTKLAEEYRGRFILAKINTEEQQALAGQFGIRSIPTVRLFKAGQPVDEFMGALPETELRAFLDRHIPRESDRMVAQANQLARQGDLDAAIRLVEEANKRDPDNLRVLIAYASFKAVLGETGEAERILAALPAEELGNPAVAGLKAQLLFDRIAQAAPAVAELQQRLTADPNDSEARYQLAARHVMAGEYEPALEQLLALLLKNRQFGDDAARKGMLAIFELLGGNDPLVNRYRSRMFNALH
jgi:putative thioredoxin